MLFDSCVGTGKNYAIPSKSWNCLCFFYLNSMIAIDIKSRYCFQHVFFCFFPIPAGFVYPILRCTVMIFFHAFFIHGLAKKTPPSLKQTYPLKIDPLEKEIPIGKHHFKGRTVSFRECNMPKTTWQFCEFCDLF